MKCVNKVIILGALGFDPETSFTQSGLAICKLKVATSEYYKNKDGMRMQSTEWHNVVIYSKLAETAQMYLKKGSRVYIEGKLKTSIWKDKVTNKNMYRTEIIANDIIFLDKKSESIKSDEFKDSDLLSDEPKFVDENNFDDEIPF